MVKSFNFGQKFNLLPKILILVDLNFGRKIKKFQDNFIWATATASYQIEGAWDADGKGENIWDKFSQNPSSGPDCNIHNCDNGNIACDSYRQTDRDIKTMTDMGIKVDG